MLDAQSVSLMTRGTQSQDLIEGFADGRPHLDHGFILACWILTVLLHMLPPIL